ncbi:glycoside hydrolase family 30 protein [Pelagicoccus albus]|uniref:Glycosyl hydrolase n=1 Tax=Pelagicoccus albus TaxID=415222 RepID=A0A7X1B836_9BACT|nr:glycoside hydrolase family 30 beta sandwich domain-containing protein [Pelagicoccus albus]MBC2607292.1 glycosyl hydrolase [Pelagicoccus albus]
MKKKNLSAAICCGLSLSIYSFAAPSPIWFSSQEGKTWQQHELANISPASESEAPNLRFDPSRTYQTIDGFGGSFNELGWVALKTATPADRTAALEALFGDDGCGFTLARIPIGSSDFAINLDGDPSTPDDDDYSLAETPEDYQLKHFSIDRDRKNLLPYIKAAMETQPNLQCWASPWSPPEWMKENNFYAGGSLRWEPKVLKTYANYFSKWINAYQDEGVNIFAVTPQNEPNQWQPFPSCVYTGDQLAEFIGDYLGPTLAKKNKEVELWFGINGDPQHDGDNFNNRIVSVLEDKEANSYLTGIAFQYDSKNQIAVANEVYPDKKLMQSESICFNGDNSWAQAMELYRLIKRHIDGGANQYYAWNMVLDDSGLGPWNWRQNAPISVEKATGKVIYNGEFFTYKHFSHYVRPGAKKILSTGDWGDCIAFLYTDGSVVAVIANSSNDPHVASLQVAGSDIVVSQEFPAQSINTVVFPAP